MWPFVGIWPHFERPGVKEIMALLLYGTKLCYDINKDIRHHRGDKINLWSLRCRDEGIKLVLTLLQPICSLVADLVLDATVGVWVVCLAVYGRFPCQSQGL